MGMCFDNIQNISYGNIQVPWHSFGMLHSFFQNRTGKTLWSSFLELIIFNLNIAFFKWLKYDKLCYVTAFII